jgi:hypothetical protein
MFARRLRAALRAVPPEDAIVHRNICRHECAQKDDSTTVQVMLLSTRLASSIIIFILPIVF